MTKQVFSVWRAVQTDGYSETLHGVYRDPETARQASDYHRVPKEFQAVKIDGKVYWSKGRTSTPRTSRRSANRRWPS